MASMLEGKVALVTGGASGIGRAAALAYAREGARVVVADLADVKAEETVRHIQKSGGEALYVKTDVSKADDVKALVRRTIEQFGRLDCAFNNAGVQEGWKCTADMSEKTWDRTIAINLKGVWLCMKYEIPEMLKADGGAIVNMSSVLGLSAFRELSAYTASKHGVVALTRTAALEYAAKGIRINAVCPGYIETPLLEGAASRKDYAGNKFRIWTKKIKKAALHAVLKKLQPTGRFGKPEEVANTVVWLSSEAASFITGQAIAIDGAHLAGRRF